MKRTSSSIEDSKPPLSQSSTSTLKVDMSRAQRVLGCDRRLPEPNECPALHAFLCGEEPSAEHFGQCLEWCAQHGYPDVVTAMQSAYPAFIGSIGMANLSPLDALSFIDTITSHRIACDLKVKVIDPAMSLHLAASLKAPQCAIWRLAIELPAWNRRTGGSLVAGLGSAIAACPSIRFVSLCGPKDGGRCELETAFIERAIANGHLLNLALGVGLDWHDSAWPELGTRILHQMLKRNDPGSISLQLADAYANAIALNGAKSGSYEVELGLSASWRSYKAQALERAPGAEKSSYSAGKFDLAYVLLGSDDGWDECLVQESVGERAAENVLVSQAAEQARYLWATFPRILNEEDEDDEEAEHLLGFLCGCAPDGQDQFEHAIFWAHGQDCMDALLAMQVRYPLFTSGISTSHWEILQVAQDLGIAFDLNIGGDVESFDGAIRILSSPHFKTRTLTFDWRSEFANAPLLTLVEATVRARSVVKVNLRVTDAHDPTGESLVLFLDSASVLEIAYENPSTQIDCPKLRPAIERALRGPLTKLRVKAHDNVLRTVVEAIGATGGACCLQTLSLYRFAAVDRNIDLGMIFRGQQRISELAFSASFASDCGHRLVEAIWRSPWIVEIRADQSDESRHLLYKAVWPHLQANIHRERYSEAGPAMLKSLGNFWSEGRDASHAMSNALQGVLRYLGERDLRNLASTSRLLSSRFRAPKMEVLDKLIMWAEALADEDLRWIVDQFKPPVLIDPRLLPLRDGLTRIATSALSKEIQFVSTTEPPRAEGTNSEAFQEAVDLELAAKVQQMVKDFNPLHHCEAVKMVLEGRQPGRDAFQACVAWCRQSECMQVVVAIQERWPTFSEVVHLDGSEEDSIAILESVLAHGIRCEVMVTITHKEELTVLETALGSPQPEMMLEEEIEVPESKPEIMRTLGIVFNLEEEMDVPISLAQKLVGAKLLGLCLIGKDRPVTLAPAFLPELLRSTSIEQLTLRGEFITGEIVVDQARQWFERSALRSLHVQANPSLIDTLGRAIVATDGKCRIVDLELLSAPKGDHPAFSWIRELLHPKLGISTLALAEEQLASLPPWQWQDVSKINHCLLDLRPVTDDFKRSVPTGVAAEMLVRNQQIRAQVTGWAVEMFMRRWAQSNQRPVLLNRPWMNQLLAYGDEPSSFDGLRSVNRAMAGLAREATGSLDVTRDIRRLNWVLHRAAQPGSGSLGVDRIVNYLRNHKHSLTAAQYARLQSAVVGRIERYLDRWQDGSLPPLQAPAAT